MILWYTDLSAKVDRKSSESMRRSEGYDISFMAIPSMSIQPHGIGGNNRIRQRRLLPPAVMPEVERQWKTRASKSYSSDDSRAAIGASFLLWQYCGAEFMSSVTARIR